MSETELEPKRTPCRGCGKPIVWGTEETTGKRIPLDPVPPVYEVQGFYNRGANDKSEGFQIVQVRRHVHAYVSHFATCPEANRFSKSSKIPSASPSER